MCCNWAGWSGSLIWDCISFSCRIFNSFHINRYCPLYFMHNFYLLQPGLFWNATMSVLKLNKTKTYFNKDLEPTILKKLSIFLFFFFLFFQSFNFSLIFCAPSIIIFFKLLIVCTYLIRPSFFFTSRWISSFCCILQLSFPRMSEYISWKRWPTSSEYHIARIQLNHIASWIKFC